MSFSSVKGLQNEMKNLEDESSLFVTPDKFYIVKIQIYENFAFSRIRSLGEQFLMCSDPQPLCVHIFSNEILLLFSCVEEPQQHFCEGDVLAIISHFVCETLKEFIKELPKINAKVVQFKTQTQVFAYLTYSIFQHSQNLMIKISEGKITQNELQFLTELELINIINKNSGIKWQNLENAEKYGILLRLRIKKGELIVNQMSEMFDARESAKYLKFIFK